MYETRDILRIQLGRLPIRDLQIVLVNVHFSEASFFVYCFLNLPAHREQDATETDPSWLATHTMYGSGPRSYPPPESAKLTWVIDLSKDKASKICVDALGDDILTLKDVDVLTLKVVGIGSDANNGALLKFDSVSFN